MIHPRLFKHRPLPGYPQIDLVLNPWKLKQVLTELQPTHVHISVEGPLGLTARFILKRLGWKYTTAYHTNFPEYAKAHYGISEKWVIPIIKWFHSNSAAVLTPSISTSQKLNKWGITKSIVWGRGFNRDVFKPNLNFTASSNLLNLLYVGRVSEEKNIKAFLNLQKEGRKLIVVGDGPIRNSLETQYPKVSFVGFKRGLELAEYYRRADVFVFPSKSDTLGVVMIEAIACGTPVVAYDVEGPKDVVSNGINGYLSIDNLEAVIQRALLIPRKTVAESAYKFTWEGSVNIFESSLVTIR